MPYGSLLSDVVQSSTANTPPQFNDGNGTQVGTLCRAWVLFDGTTGTKTSSFNVSSVTRSSTGNYVINFTNAMPDANYAVSFGVYQFYRCVSLNVPATASQLNISGLNIDPASAGGYADVTGIHVAIHR